MKKNLYKGIALLGVLTCFLSACGPEPGKEETKEETGDSLFAQEEVSSGQTGTVQDEPDPETAGTGGTADPGAEAGEDLQQTDPEKGGTGAAAEETGQDSSAETAEEKYVERTPLDSQALEEIEAYLNEDSSYGFLLSSYERPDDIDLAQVFYTGAGAPQEKLEEKEEKLLLERTNQESFMTSDTKVKEEYIEELLSRKAGITYEESGHPLDSWAHIGRYAAYYHLHGDTNRVTVRCTDGWQQGDTFILHYQISAGVPLQTKEAENPVGAGAAPVEEALHRTARSRPRKAPRETVRRRRKEAPHRTARPRPRKAPRETVRQALLQQTVRQISLQRRLPGRKSLQKVFPLLQSMRKQPRPRRQLTTRPPMKWS